MFKVAVGCSDDIDTDDAVAQVIARCENELGSAQPTTGLLFCGNEFDHRRTLDAIMDRWPDIALVGCTTDGEMSRVSGFTEDAMALTLICSDAIRVTAGIGHNAGAEPKRAARDAVAMACSGLDDEVPRLALVMPDGLTANAFDVLEGFTERLGREVPVVGGMSADRVGGSKQGYSTYQFFGREILTDSVPTVLFAGPLVHSLGVESGWSPLGQRMTVTRSQGNLLHELDGRPAFELFTHYLGELTRDNLSGLGSYPLAVYEEGLDRYYLRIARAADPDTGTVTFLGEIPEGAEVQITQAVRDSVLEGAQRSIDSALGQYRGESPDLAMMFSCTGRKIVLGTRTGEEVRSVARTLDKAVPLCGFYTFGEIGPVAEHAHARYHNTTFVTLLLGEA